MSLHLPVKLLLFTLIGSLVLPGGPWARGNEPGGQARWRQLVAALCDDGPTLRPLLPEQTILSISSRTTPETSMLLTEALADRNALERLGIERETLTELLAGLKFVTPIIQEQVHPEAQLVFVRQTFSDPHAPLPQFKLPGVAMVFRPRDIHEVRRTLLSAYWAAMIQADQTARQQNRPGLRLESARLGNGFYAAASFRAPPDDRADLQGLVEYNFSSAIGFAGERVFLASSRELVRELVELANAEPHGNTLVREKVRIDMAPTVGLHWVADNHFALLQSAGLTDDALAWLDAHDSLRQRLLSKLPTGRVTLRYSPLSRYLRPSRL